MGPTTRTFVALPLSHPVQRAIGRLQEELGKASDLFRWPSPANIHLTLAFLGDVPTPETDRVCRVVQTAVAETRAFAIEPKGLGMFPPERRPRVMWVGIERGADQVQRLHAVVALALVDAGFDVDARHFTAHITIGRARPTSRRRGNLEDWPRQFADWRAEPMAVDEVLTLASQLDRSGSVYTALGRARLAAAG